MDLHNLGPIFTTSPKEVVTGSVQISMKFSVLILLLVGGSFLAKDQRKHVGAVRDFGCDPRGDCGYFAIFF